MLRFCVIILFALLSNFALAQNFSEGVYIIRLASNPSFVIDVTNGDNVCLHSYNGANTQKWKLSYYNNDMIFANVANSTNAIDIRGGEVVNGSNIIVYRKHNGVNQRWIVESCGNGYVIRSAANRNYAIDLDHAKAVNGQNILLWGLHKGEGQIWKLEKVDQNNTAQLPPSETTQEQQAQRKVVKTWEESYGAAYQPGYTKYTKYSDGRVESEIYNTCVKYCEGCSGIGFKTELFPPYVQVIRIICPECKGKKVCKKCNGTGYTYKGRGGYWDITEYYSDGNSGFRFEYKTQFVHMASLLQGTKRIVPFESETKRVDAGNYWQFGPAKISKDLQTLIYNNKTYKKCSSQEYQRLYGEELKKANENNVPYVPPVTGGNNDGISTPKYPCSRCNKSGTVLLDSRCWHLGTYPRVSCDNVYCNACWTTHCKENMRHTTCPACHGSGYW